MVWARVLADYYSYTGVVNALLRHPRNIRGRVKLIVLCKSKRLASWKAQVKNTCANDGKNGNVNFSNTKSRCFQFINCPYSWKAVVSMIPDYVFVVLKYCGIEKCVYTDSTIHVC